MILTVINIVIRLNEFTDNGSISSRVCKQFILYRLRGFATRKYVRFSWENFAFQLDVHVFKTSMSSKALISPSIGGLFKAVVSVGYAIIIHNYRLMLLRADLSDTRSEHAISFAVLVDFYNQTDCEAMQVNRMFDFDICDFMLRRQRQRLRHSGIQIEYWIQEGFLVSCLSCNSPSHVLKGLKTALRLKS